MPGFSDFGLIFSLGFGFASLPELRIFMVAAACLRMQSLLQYTESGWATLKQPGPMHLEAPGASITYREKWSEVRLQRGKSRNSLWNTGKRLHSPLQSAALTCTIASMRTTAVPDTTQTTHTKAGISLF